MRASSLALVVASGAALFYLRTLALLSTLVGTGKLDQNDAFLPPPLRESLVEKATRATSSPLHDKTLHWNATIHRMWLQEKGPTPPAVVTLTSLYWNHPNQTFGLSHFRTQRSTQLLQGVLNHPWFHPTAWDDLVEGRWRNDSTRIYVFFDYETCGEKNYPDYGKGLKANADGIGNRTTDWRTFHPQNPFRALVNMTVLWKYPQLKVIILDCGGEGPRYFCLSRDNNPYQQISLASISAVPEHHFPQDQGFPPPVVKETFLSETIRNNIAECREDTRPYLLTFAGNFRHEVRKQLRDFVHNGEDILFANGNMMRKKGMEYGDLVLQSKFGAAPRGDNRFSYRFVEVMSGGAIPVLYADDLVLPFENVINWQEIAVRIPENQTNRTREILIAISDEERCRMRQKMLLVYERYLRTGEATIAGIIDGLEKKMYTNQWTTTR